MIFNAVHHGPTAKANTAGVDGFGLLERQFLPKRYGCRVVRLEQEPAADFPDGNHRDALLTLAGADALCSSGGFVVRVCSKAACRVFPRRVSRITNHSFGGIQGVAALVTLEFFAGAFKTQFHRLVQICERCVAVNDLHQGINVFWKFELIASLERPPGSQQNVLVINVMPVIAG